MDALANDDDLSVYEDIDCDDSSDIEDNTLAFESAKNGSSLALGQVNTKLSGYKLIKHMEDSR